MSEIIRLFPSRLNLNGDQANALVLQKRAAWAGHSIEVVDYEETSTLQPIIERLTGRSVPTVVILGHGSLAAMVSIAHLKGQIEELLAICKLNGQTALVVGSCTEWLLDHEEGERVSEFWTGSITYECKNFEVNGYLNSQALLGPNVIDGSLFYTLLHGPLLAKSEALADFLISNLVGDDVNSENRETISGFVQAAIKTATS